jgi:membrane protein DedA with SNARE-associated domain
MDFLVDFLIEYTGPIPYAVVFLVLLICGLGVPIPEDLTLVAAGIVCYYGICDVHLMILVTFVGVMIGDSFMFWLGSRYGKRLLNYWPFKVIIDESRLASIRKKLQNHRGKLLFSARFMPGLRSTIFFSTGLLHFPYRSLLMYDGLAALISVPAIVYSVFYFGDFLEEVILWIKKVEHGIVFVIVGLLLFLIVRALLKRRKKRREADL